MTTAVAVLQAGVQLGIAASALYTVPTGSGQTVVRQAVFTNVDTVARTITVYRVASGGAAGAANTIIKDKRLTPGQSYVAPEVANMVLNSGDSIQALASAATAVTAVLMGYTL